MALIFFTPLAGINLDFEAVLFIHIASFLSLGLLYEFPEFMLDLYTMRLIRQQYNIQPDRLIARLRKIIALRFVATHIVGPMAGVMTVTSGLLLINVAHHSFLEGWLFWIVPTAAFFVWKGFFHHNLYMRLLIKKIKEQNLNRDELKRIICSPFDVILNLLELPGYLFIFLCDYYKPSWIVFGRGQLQNLQDHLPNNACLGIIIFFAVLIFFTPFLIWSIKKWSVCVSNIEVH